MHLAAARFALDCCFDWADVCTVGKLTKVVLSFGILIASFGSLANAADVRVTVQSMSSPGSVALSPFSVAVHNGSFDAFNTGMAASPGVELVAELGDGTEWLTAATNSHPQAVTGVLTATVNGFGPGIFLPGGSGSLTLSLDPSENRYFSYGAMVVPSNDAFLGNDASTSIELFDADGSFVGQTVTVLGSEIWDAGTEVNQLLGAAYLVGQTATDGAAENGTVVPVDPTAQFSPYLGGDVPSGGAFSSLPIALEPLVTISFQLVPEPSNLELLPIAMIGAVHLIRRNRKKSFVTRRGAASAAKLVGPFGFRKGEGR